MEKELKNNFLIKFEEILCLNRLIVDEMDILIDAIEKQIPKKPAYFKNDEHINKFSKELKYTDYKCLDAITFFLTLVRNIAINVGKI